MNEVVLIGTALVEDVGKLVVVVVVVAIAPPMPSTKARVGHEL